MYQSEGVLPTELVVEELDHLPPPPPPVSDFPSPPRYPPSTSQYQYSGANEMLDDGDTGFYDQEANDHQLVDQDDIVQNSSSIGDLENGPFSTKAQVRISPQAESCFAQSGFDDGRVSVGSRKSSRKSMRRIASSTVASATVDKKNSYRRVCGLVLLVCYLLLVTLAAAAFGFFGFECWSTNIASTFSPN